MKKLWSTLITVFMLSILIAPQAKTTLARAETRACPPDCLYKYYLAQITKGYLVPQGGLIIDHRHIDITQIPDEWLTKAKALTFHYAHTSHGGQIFEGLEYLQNHVNAKYNYAVEVGVTPPSLPAGTNILKFYDGNNYPGDSYITPEMYWEQTDGISHTLSTANTGLFDYSMWSWCWQADSEASYINQYLTQMNAFDTAYPDMRFILMTGHNVDAPGTNLLARNQQIRDYASANDMVLFDFADIETYDPEGGFHDPTTTNYHDGGCDWCDSWCASHPGYCDAQMLDTSCAHTHPLFCKMKAQAFWWMMARLAGWPGTP
jgi:hypothetical protein